MNVNVQVKRRFKTTLKEIPLSSSGGNTHVPIVSMEQYLEEENERRRAANAEIAARVNVTKLKAMIAELKHRKKLSDEDDED